MCEIKRFRDGHSRCHGTMGSQASRDTCEGDIRLRVARLLSPICSGSPSTFAVAGPEVNRPPPDTDLLPLHSGAVLDTSTLGVGVSDGIAGPTGPLRKCSRSPSTEVGERFENNFCITPYV